MCQPVWYFSTPLGFNHPACCSLLEMDKEIYTIITHRPRRDFTTRWGIFRGGGSYGRCWVMKKFFTIRCTSGTSLKFKPERDLKDVLSHLLETVFQRRFCVEMLKTFCTCRTAGRGRCPAQEGYWVSSSPEPWCARRWCPSECIRPPHTLPAGCPGYGTRGLASAPAPQ